MTARRRIYQILDGSWARSDRTALAVNLFMVVLIVVNVAAVIVESLPDFRARYGTALMRFEILSVTIFAVEYALRMWSCTEDDTGRFQRPIHGRIRYFFTPLALIDLLAIAPGILLLTGGVDLRFLRVFRLFWLLKLSRYFPAMHMVGRVFHAQRRALLSALFVMLVILVFAASLMYIVEREVQPVAFGSIPDAMWWAVATLTTVGYGDVTPITPLGKVLGSCIALIGIGMFALPAAILASGFTEEMERRDVEVTWTVVATLPVFEHLTALQIAEIARLLRFKTAVPGEILFRKGDAGDCLYFVKSGRVDIAFTDRIFHIDDGDFFGEMALLAGTRRSATATAVSSCRMLVLDRSDFEDLCEEHPAIAEHFIKVANDRLSELPRRDDQAPFKITQLSQEARAD